MQLYSESYKKLIIKYINHSDAFIGTLSKIYNDEFTDRLRDRDDIEVVEVTLENRGVLKNELIARVAKSFP